MTPHLVKRRWVGLAASTIVMSTSIAIGGPPPALAAVAHVDNPYVEAAQYLDPRYAAAVEATARQTADATLAARMRTVKTYPTAVWLDRMAAIDGRDGGPGLVGHLDAAVAQQRGGVPVVATFVIYDLPGRDCAALASNGELPPTAAGLATYQRSYLDPIAAIFSRPAYRDLRIVTVIEPDSLPNLVTNLGLPACALAHSSGIYVSAVRYALDRLHAIPNVYTYLDIGHSGWLGWPNNSGATVSLYTDTALGTSAGLSSVDGFVSNVANTTPLEEPFLDADHNVGGRPVKSATYYEWNPDIDEADFAADLYHRFTSAGWPSDIGFLVDTSRNGWGGTARPNGPSTSGDLETYVSESRIDRRAHRGLWCNQDGAGLGEPPTAQPADHPSAHLDAYVWVKPPGDSDGASRYIPNDEGKGFDPMCDPAYMTRYGVKSGALPDAPLAGHWFAAQFTQLVRNAHPVVPPAR